MSVRIAVSHFRDRHLARLRTRAVSALRKRGWLPAPINRCVLVTVSNPPDYAALEPVLSSLRRERLSSLFIPGNEDVKKDLIEQFGQAAVPDAPWNNRLSSLLFLLTWRVELLIGIDGIDSLPRSLLKQARALGIGIAVIAARLPEPQGGDMGVSRFVDLWLSYEAAISEQPPAMNGLRLLRARRPPVRSPLQTLVAQWLDKPSGRQILGTRARRIDTLAELRAALGYPQTILCLGNGPSCEDPALAQLSYDSLFRVNRRWLARNLHCDPQMVFTGEKRTLSTIHNRPIFAFQTRLAEAH